MVLCLEEILPCKVCRESFRIINQSLPVTACLTNDLDPVHWVYHVHNVVNIKIGKACFPRASLDRLLRLLDFSSGACARMIFVVSLWADKYCVNRRRAIALNTWFRQVLRLARQNACLGTFNDAFRGFHGVFYEWDRDDGAAGGNIKDVLVRDNTPEIRQVLANIMNAGVGTRVIGAARSVSWYVKEYGCVFATEDKT